jgi:hypothetical protein
MVGDAGEALEAVSVDQIEEVDYNHHQFIKYTYVSMGRPPIR